MWLAVAGPVSTPNICPNCIKATSIIARSTWRQAADGRNARRAGASAPAWFAWNAGQSPSAALRQTDRQSRRRLQAHLHSLRASYFPRTDPVVIMLVIDASGPLPAWPQSAFPRRACILLPRRLHRAGRNDRRRRAARNPGGIRHQGRPGALSRQPALADAAQPDDRLLWRSA